jgi:hypothetical protein
MIRSEAPTSVQGAVHDDCPRRLQGNFLVRTREGLSGQALGDRLLRACAEAGGKNAGGILDEQN